MPAMQHLKPFLLLLCSAFITNTATHAYKITITITMSYSVEFSSLPQSVSVRTHTSPSNTSNFFHYISYSSRSLPTTHTKYLQENGCGKQLYEVQRNKRPTDYADLASCFLLKTCQSEYVNWQRHLRKAGGEGAVDELYQLANCWERNTGAGELNHYAKFTKYLDDVKDATF